MLGPPNPPRSRPAGPAAYPAREDTRLILGFARRVRGRLLLEIGTGGGLVALTAARAGARVVATDLNRAALRELRRSARSESLPLEAVRTDLFAGLGRFDRVLLNPPYLPTPPGFTDPELPTRWAVDGGPDGLALTRRFLVELPAHLAPGGVGYLLFSSLQPALAVARLRAAWQAAGGRWRPVAARRLDGERLFVVRLSGPLRGSGGRGGRSRRRSAGPRPRRAADRVDASSPARGRKSRPAPGAA